MDLQPVCANWTPENATCKKVGNFGCKNCQLITYCGSECQKLHWSVHKRDCKSFLGKSNWQPNWVLEGRTPSFVRARDRLPPWGCGILGGRKYLWGNVPAFDILQLGSNEGEAYGEDLRLLFAASGDLRNVITTIAQLPHSYKKPVEVTINDHDLDVVARNVIILLLAFVVKNMDEAAECIIHIWYSALIRKSDFDIIQQQVRPLIEGVCQKTEGKPGSTLLSKTWAFGNRSLKLVLHKSAWDALLTLVDNRNGLTVEEAHAVRKAITLAEERKDFRDRWLSVQSDFHRVALTRFREDGLLLPFGAPRDDFKYPNPTLFNATQTWPMTDKADPLHGWSLKAIQETSSGPANADIYGKLSTYLRTLLRTFANRLACQQQFSFRMYHVDARALHKYLEAGSFSRIEVSNITDVEYLGIHQTLKCMIPLLQGPLTNPHATLITLLMNAVHETKLLYGADGSRLSAQESAQDPTMQRALRYLSAPRSALTPNSPIVFKLMSAWAGVTSHDDALDRYMAKFEFSKAAELAGAAMKNEHTVIEKWPFRLKLRPGQPGAQDEFDRSIGGGVSSMDRYIEWKRV